MSPHNALIYLVLTGFLSTACAGLDEWVADDEKGDYKSAAAEFKALVKQGGSGEQLNLGVMYYSGNGVPQNHKEAYAWFSVSAASGQASAVKKPRYCC